MTMLNIAFSPCPNDTFLFYAMLHERVNARGLQFTPHMHDIDVLNQKATAGCYHVTKLSGYAALLLHNDYDILDSGAAVGYGCGPLLVARSLDISLKGATIAIPGNYTTANLLFKLWAKEAYQARITRFDMILDGVASGLYDAGIIIHEGRFVYERYGCKSIVDLGEWWEKKTGLPIPLGVIAVNRKSGAYPLKSEIEKVIRDSATFSLNNRDDSKDFIKQHSQELEDSVIARHIDLYVNDFTLSLGDTGLKSLRTLQEMARHRGLL